MPGRSSAGECSAEGSALECSAGGSAGDARPRVRLRGARLGLIRVSAGECLAGGSAGECSAVGPAGWKITKCDNDNYSGSICDSGVCIGSASGNNLI